MCLSPAVAQQRHGSASGQHVQQRWKLIGYATRLCLQDAEYAQRDSNDLLALPGSKTHRVICDTDGMLRCVGEPWAQPAGMQADWVSHVLFGG
jgi:hypothetical protein